MVNEENIRITSNNVSTRLKLIKKMKQGISLYH